MINHARTLLMNVDGESDFFPATAEEIIPTNYTAKTLPSYLRNIRRVLFGENPDREMLNYRCRQYMQLLHATDLVEFVQELDPRITYGFDDIVLLDNTQYGLSYVQTDLSAYEPTMDEDSYLFVVNGDGHLSSTKPSPDDPGDFLEGESTGSFMTWLYPTGSNENITLGGHANYNDAGFTEGEGVFVAVGGSYWTSVDENNLVVSCSEFGFGPIYGYTTNNVLANSYNKWLHICFTFDGSGVTNADKLKLYVNGIEQPLTFVGTVPTTVPSGSADFRAGITSQDATTIRMRGTFAHMAYYASALTESQVSRIIQRGDSSDYTTNSDVVAYWPLNTGDVFNEELVRGIASNRLTAFVTYLPDRDQYFEPAANYVTGAGQVSTPLYFVGGGAAGPDGAGAVLQTWELTQTSTAAANAVRVEGGARVEDSYSLTVSGAGLYDPIRLPGSDVKVAIAEQANQAKWRVTYRARPQVSLGAINASLRMLGNDVALTLFGVGTSRADTEPFKTFLNLWNNSDDIAYKLGAVLLATIYRTGELDT